MVILYNFLYLLINTGVGLEFGMSAYMKNTALKLNPMHRSGEWELAIDGIKTVERKMRELYSEH